MIKSPLVAVVVRNLLLAKGESRSDIPELKQIDGIQIEVADHQVGIDADRFLELSHSVVVMLHPQIDSAQVVMGGAGVRV